MVLQRLMCNVDDAKVTKKCHTCNSKMSIIEDFADFETIFAYCATRFAYFESREPF
jgi:hypothetical protein